MPTTYRLRRTGAVDVAFEGELLADQTTQRPDAQRWMEIRIYRTTTGKYVVEETGCSVDGTSRPVVTVVDEPADVRAALTKTGTPGDPTLGKRVEYLTNVALDAIEEASEADPDLRAAAVEVI